MGVSSAEPQTKPAELVKYAFEGLARLRSARVFHPDGATFAGTVVLTEARSPTTGALGGTWPVHVRASKGLGTPGAWPDIHGLAVRIVHEDGPVDLLFATAGRLVPWVLTPSIGWFDHPYTTLLPYTVGDKHVVLRLDADEPEIAHEGDIDAITKAVSFVPVRFTVKESSGLSWRPIGTLTLEMVTEETIAFDPVVHQHPRVRHPRILAPLRHFAYLGSRQGRGAENDDLTS
jgi:hypothetical protein